jgi:hypothetical protein
MAVERIELEPDKRVGTRMCLCWAQFRLGLLHCKVFSRAVTCVCVRAVGLLPGSGERTNGRVPSNIQRRIN